MEGTTDLTAADTAGAAIVPGLAGMTGAAEREVVPSADVEAATLTRIGGATAARAPMALAAPAIAFVGMVTSVAAELPAVPAGRVILTGGPFSAAAATELAAAAIAFGGIVTSADKTAACCS